MRKRREEERKISAERGGRGVGEGWERKRERKGEEERRRRKEGKLVRKQHDRDRMVTQREGQESRGE